MTRKASESQFKLMALFDHLAAKVRMEGGVFMGEELTRNEAKSAESQLRGIARKYEELARKNESIDN